MCVETDKCLVRIDYDAIRMTPIDRTSEIIKGDAGAVKEVIISREGDERVAPAPLTMMEDRGSTTTEQQAR